MTAPDNTDGIDWGESNAVSSMWWTYYAAVGRHYPVDSKDAQLCAFYHGVEATLLIFKELSELNLTDDQGANMLEKVYAECDDSLARLARRVEN